MAYINIAEIPVYTESAKWLKFRNTLTQLDVEKLKWYVSAGLRPRWHTDYILGVPGGHSEGVHGIQGFLPSSVTSYGLLRPRMEDTQGIPEHPVLLASGIPVGVGQGGRMHKYRVVDNARTRYVLVDAIEESLLISCSGTSNAITLGAFCGVLKGTGVCSIPSSLFYVYTGACRSGMSHLYPDNFTQYLDSNYGGTLPVEITPEIVLQVRGKYNAQGFTNLLGYIAKAVNNTLQSRKTVRNLAVECGIIEKA